jgi:hypothetical protein
MAAVEVFERRQLNMGEKSGDVETDGRFKKEIHGAKNGTRTEGLQKLRL